MHRSTPGIHTDFAAGSSVTPSQMVSSRRSRRTRSLVPARSSSPKKSGISGHARKSNGVDIFSTRKDLRPEDREDRENTPVITPTRSVQLRNHSPDPGRHPLSEITTDRPYLSEIPRPSLLDIERAPSEIFEAPELDAFEQAPEEVNAAARETEDYEPLVYDNGAPAEVSNLYTREQPEELGSLPQGFGDEESDQIFQPKSSVPPGVQNLANSRKKRKSDIAEEGDEELCSAVPTKFRKTNAKRLTSQQEKRKAAA